MLWMSILFNVFRIISLWSHNYETTKVTKGKLDKVFDASKQLMLYLYVIHFIMDTLQQNKQELFIIICKWLKITQGCRSIKKTLIEYKLYTDIKLSKFILPS